MNKKKAFTLLELLIVIIILGVLSSFITSNFLISLKKGRDARRKGDLEQIQRALELYYEDKRAYPSNISFGQSLTDTETGKIYMNKIPNDPSGNSYKYESDGTYYKLYACLENNQQILPYISNPTNFTCNNFCKNNQGNNVRCIWGVSSSNTNP
ncbi:MAG: hypothetical protein KatS3mg092_0866 [Patescibacteria group bacterium]|nr:MAG: hypothetical protein KatS3mg092_0866 [Patescibacteria group bacterium]